MSSKEQSESTLDADTEHEVADYLRAHPDLLLRHPDVLDALVVPHEPGGAVSLVDYQLRRLRAENGELHRRLQTLVRNARDNEDLGARMHGLTLSLVECASVDEMFARLYQALHDDFQADFTALRVFARPRDGDDRGLAEFVVTAAPGRELFDSVLAGERPVCGRLGRDQAVYLFGERGADVGSGALIPLGRASAFGLLAVCSSDPERYHTGMGTVFLRQLGGTVTHVIEPYLERP